MSSPPQIARNPLSRKRVIARTEDTPVASLASSSAEVTETKTSVGNIDMPPPPPPQQRQHQQKISKPAFDIVEATSAVTSRPQTPSSSSSSSSAAGLPQQQQQQQQQQQPASAAERGLLRGAIDEKKLYSGYRSQTEKWLALAHIGQNFIIISMRADTAVDFARETQQ